MLKYKRFQTKIYDHSLLMLLYISSLPPLLYHWKPSCVSLVDSGRAVQWWESVTASIWKEFEKNFQTIGFFTNIYKQEIKLRQKTIKDLSTRFLDFSIFHLDFDKYLLFFHKFWVAILYSFGTQLYLETNISIYNSSHST